MKSLGGIVSHWLQQQTSNKITVRRTYELYGRGEVAVPGFSSIFILSRTNTYRIEDGRGKKTMHS